MKELDLITVGRSGIDLYGAQVGGRLEDMGSFQKYIGGSPTNIAAGSARLGLKSGLITRVGDEHMGRFICETLKDEGVDTDGIVVDPERLTALVILGIRDQSQFPLIFYRTDCADMALCEEDIDPKFVARARCIAVTGTHLSNPRTEAAVLKTLKIANKNGAKKVLDIDYRPNLWGLTGHGDGENRFIASDHVTRQIQKHLHLFDLIVGTEEEFHIAGGNEDTIVALRAIRGMSDATLVCKRGAEGAVALTDKIPDCLNDGQSGLGFPIEVFNVLGAGDGFMSGLLKGWLDGEDWPTILKYANACGALAVSRHGCTPAYPSWDELQFFLKRGIKNPALRKDIELEQIHWSTNRKGDWPEMRIFAFDHTLELERLPNATAEKIDTFKQLCLKAALKVQKGRSGYGILCDSRMGQKALHQAAGKDFWIGRPVEWLGSRPLVLGSELGSDFRQLSEWPLQHVVKVASSCNPKDDEVIRSSQEQSVKRLFESARYNKLEFLLEITPSKAGEVKDGKTAKLIQRFYDLGVFPDWWKLEPLKTSNAWKLACDAIIKNDSYSRGIVLDLNSRTEELFDKFKLAAQNNLVKGFSVGKAIYGNVAQNWMHGRITETEAVNLIAQNYSEICRTWDSAQKSVT
ncbi:MAG: 5-dehydro-2-deoxygluconokinase [Woeseiaceae bacterium]|nr:5-dehydro-2-deoxygluconokinase [Woeseiaceae bacterium]